MRVRSRPSPCAAPPSAHLLIPPSRPPLEPVRLCRVLAELIRSKGDTQMTVEQLTHEIIPHGRSAPRLPHRAARRPRARRASSCDLPNPQLSALRSTRRSQRRCPTRSKPSCCRKSGASPRRRCEPRGDLQGGGHGSAWEYTCLGCGVCRGVRRGSSSCGCLVGQRRARSLQFR